MHTDLTAAMIAACLWVMLFFKLHVWHSSNSSILGRYLLTDQNRMRSVNDIMPMIGARFYTQLDAAQMRNDVIEEDLAKVKRAFKTQYTGLRLGI